jgi:hypothetical protein
MLSPQQGADACHENQQSEPGEAPSRPARTCLNGLGERGFVSGVYGLVHEFAVEVFINFAQRPSNFRGSGNDLQLTRAATTRALVPSLSQLKWTALAIIALILRNKALAARWPTLCERRFHYIHINIMMERAGMRRARVWDLTSGASASAAAAGFAKSQDVAMPACATLVASAEELMPWTDQSQSLAAENDAIASRTCMP